MNMCRDCELCEKLCDYVYRDCNSVERMMEMTTKQFIRMNGYKATLIHITYRNDLHRYEGKIFGVRIIADTYNELKAFLEELDFAEVEVIE